MIAPNTIQQITSRIDIIEIVGEFVKLKKRGANYLGNCPFHNEKSPSFTVSPAKEIYKCFGCGKSGNAIGFLMEHEKYNYVEALRWLANRYNIEIEEKEVTPEVKQHQLVAESLHAINNFAQKHLSYNLFETADGKDIALTYLQQRGFREEILHKFQVGYNLDQRDDLAKALIQNQFNSEFLLKSGLVTQRSEGLADNYRNRIIFPIHNITGKIIGFGARIIKTNDKAPKYINTPENEIYVKSKILYGTYFARQAISRLDECLLVEGYTDVVSLHQAGIENVVASGGTSLTIDQLRLVKKNTDNLTIIYDGDSAGVKAALRGLDMALEEGLNVKLVLIPDNEDPDSYVNKVGTTAFQQFIKDNKKDFILFQLEVMLKEAGSDTSKRSVVVNTVADTLSRFNKAEDFTKLQDYIRQCAELLKIDETGLTTLVNKLKRDKVAKEQKTFDNKPDEAQTWPESTPNPEDDLTILFYNDEPQEKNLIRVLLEFGLRPWDEEKTIADYILEQLDEYHVEHPDLEKLLEVYKMQYHDGLEPTSKTLLYHEDAVIRDLVINLDVQPYELSVNWDKIMEGMNINNQDNSRQDVIISLNYFKLRKIKKMFEDNQKDIEKAATLEEQMQLIMVHKSLKEEEQLITKEMGAVIVK